MHKTHVMAAKVVAIVIGLGLLTPVAQAAAPVFSENFDSPVPPDGHVFFAGDPLYTKSILGSTGGDLTGNNYSDALINSSFDTIASDQSGTGFFLYNNTACTGSTLFNGEVWGTIAQVSVTPNTSYIF